MLLHAASTCLCVHPLCARPQSDLTAYPIVFDVNLDYANAMNRMTYLVDGHYIDNQTKSVDMQLITFNGETRMLLRSHIIPLSLRVPSLSICSFAISCNHVKQHSSCTSFLSDAANPPLKCMPVAISCGHVKQHASRPDALNSSSQNPKP